MPHSPVALVTGAARRIGAGLVSALHERGYHVIIHYNHSDEEARALAHRLNASRANSARLLQADLSHLTQLTSLAAQIESFFGRLDLLINNASAFYPTVLGKVTAQDWQTIMGSNVQGALFLAQALMPLLRQQRGCIINMVDIHIARPLPHYSVYCAAKAALASITRSLAVEMAPEVTVNGIAPGAILWPEQALSAEQKADTLSSIPLQRLGTVADIAHAMLFLVEANYLTGQIIAVDGGRSVASQALV
ncbi:pteridine reductase [Salinimonas sediminis]|uniref:Pteridine reductase n=1 Tax=Salinimonas sediminis TaxID=2303538 RepID=A0A346NKZ1_9ALTE|nr:pteridine reductase [Salinimonas sediminis]AXR06198.1 pteridine reductase [Salinimonas sediminis]